MSTDQRQRLVLGWREWLSLPELGLPHIKAKIDTGARTSALHAFEVSYFEHDGQPLVRFAIHPLQRRTDMQVVCTAPVIDRRRVKDSGGHSERRYVICTPVVIGNESWPIELTLTNRDTMGFRMLLGRTAMHGRIVVDPDASFLMGRPPRAWRSGPAPTGASRATN